MSEDFALACDPSALAAAGDRSASIVTFDGDQRIGQAAHKVEGDGDLIIVLGKVDAKPPYNTPPGSWRAGQSRFWQEGGTGHNPRFGGLLAPPRRRVFRANQSLKFFTYNNFRVRSALV